jgi:hypothetical protein
VQFDRVQLNFGAIGETVFLASEIQDVTETELGTD